MLWAGLRVAMWTTHLGGKFRHGLLEKSLIIITSTKTYFCDVAATGVSLFAREHAKDFVM